MSKIKEFAEMNNLKLPACPTCDDTGVVWASDGESHDPCDCTLYKNLPRGKKNNLKPMYCSHKWATYNSGFTMFEYCEKCNERKDK